MKMIKKIFLCVLVPVLLLSCPIMAFADDMEPDDYIFIMVLRACGLETGKNVEQWKEAYKGYLEVTGNQVLLNQLQGYRNLSWGATATGIDTLLYSVRDWLSLSEVYGTDGKLYELPSKSSPQPVKLSSVCNSIRSTPFSDINPLPESGYHYLFSDLFYNPGNGRPYYARRNVYGPNGREIFGITPDYSSFGNRVWVYFYVLNPSSSTGYSRISLKSMNIGYYVDNDSLCFKNTASLSWDWTSLDIRSVMNFPFKVFVGTQAAEEYCKTGKVSHIFSKDKCALWLYENHEDTSIIQKSPIKILNSSMILPSDLSRALVCVSTSLFTTDFSERASALSAGGLKVDYHIPYTVEHYIQTDIRPGGEKVWEKKDVDECEGYYCDPVSYEERVYDLYSLSPDLTENGDSTLPAEGNLVVRLYYEKKPPSVIAADSIGDVANVAGKGIISAFLKSFHWIFIVVFAIYLIKLIKSVLKLLFHRDSSSTDYPSKR